MKKCLWALLFLSMGSLYAEKAPRFVHTVAISKSEEKSSEYLAKFKIDRIADETAGPVAFTAPELLCVEGQEAIFAKKIDGNGYIIKVLIYKAGQKTKAKTVVVILENDENVFTSSEDFDVLK